MANISITPACNRRCRYCFARGVEQASPMSRELFLSVLAFLRASQIDQVRLLGGEPTLHPDFNWFVETGLDEGFRILIFSNGLIDEKVLTGLCEISPERISLLINIAAPGEKGGGRKTQIRSLSLLGERARLGFNIHTADVRLEFLVDLVEEHGLSRTIRLGLAHPVLGAGNEHLTAKKYGAVGGRVAQFIRDAFKKNITVELDCGFVPCMFPPEFRESGLIAADALGRQCGAIPDILADGRAIPCYPLAHHTVKSYDHFANAGELRAELDRSLQPLREFGIYRECSICHWKSAGECLGGCMALAATRSHQSQASTTVKTIKSVEPLKKKWMIPYIDQPLSFWQAIHDRWGEHIRGIYFPLPPADIGSGRPPQPQQHLNSLLEKNWFSHSLILNPITLPQPIAALGPRIAAAVRLIDERFGVDEVTIANPQLAPFIRAVSPQAALCASVLMDITHPLQLKMIEGWCTTIVPGSRIMRDAPSLRRLRAAFSGEIRLIVNEACLPGCPYRVQHFHEMANGIAMPESLCETLLAEKPWLRLTGSWVLPQHLRLYDGLYDQLKLAGRVTLQDPQRYLRVLEAYILRLPLRPHEIGGGPASVLQTMEISEEFYRRTLECGHDCDSCLECQNYGK